MPQRWLHRIVESPILDRLGELLRAGGRVAAHGSWGSSTNLLAGALAVRLSRPVLLVTAHLDDADDAMEDLSLFPAAGLPLERQRFGALEVLPGESNVSLEMLAERLAVVEGLIRSGQATKPTESKVQSPKSKVEEVEQGASVLIAPIQALMQSVPEPQALGEFSLALKPGMEMPPARLLDWLDRAGYSRVDAIEQPGDFTTRGGIIDIYLPSGMAQESDQAATSSSGPLPIRLDYFGDEIESISIIDTETMGSAGRIGRVQVIGASVQRLQSDDRTTTLLALLPPTTIVVLHEIVELAEQARGYYERLTQVRGIYAPQSVLKTLTQRTHLEVNQYGSTADKAGVIQLPIRALPSFHNEARLAVEELAELAGIKNEAVVATEQDRRAGSDEEAGTVVALCQKPAEQQRLIELLQEHVPAALPQIQLEIGYLHRGFVWDEENSPKSKVQSPKLTGQPAGGADFEPSTLDLGPLFLVPHHELFHRYEVRRRIRRIGSAALGGDRGTEAFIDLEPGDYVVHVDHGIARFVGLRTMRRQGMTEDYLTLEFADKALLHVPATQIELVQKYIGGFQGRPPLSLLGGKRWARQKQQVSEAVKDLAAHMLRIQAARASMPGVRFPPDTPWQHEFEAEFPYEETDDQLAAIAEVKKDMADEQPMDRLICGDVGFGKTEVAIRAAFKAIEFGKQTAVLVPTTVLAEQHERTFRGRMADYPFRIESISRFKTAGEQTKTLEALARGEIDVIIGTHRVLSEDVRFADLGLVIVDEEQRFGVEHKQKLLQFRLTADVLTLTATPIPRTLHMAMLGLRDISSLSTAPLDRRAIVTEVIPYDKERIRRALIRELGRDGQVYFVHNRVHNIQSVAEEVQKLAPDARIVVGHGQMPGHQLEEVMLKFLHRKADILVCTTIIESGLDIPTANTIIINEADNFGLADLHQLRGRVGRYKHRAYCYLLLPEDRPVTDKAARRLKAIEQYSMLGAGFKIAMRDLEIRGAGNLLGAEQSGHIAAVGYQMYCALLEQEARKMRHEKVIEPVRTHLELFAGSAGSLGAQPVSDESAGELDTGGGANPTAVGKAGPGRRGKPAPAKRAPASRAASAGRIPPSYIASEKHRMEAYRRISKAATLAELDTVAKDLTDAYGPAPAQAQMLLDMAELRIAASTLGVEAIKVDGPDVIFRTPDPQKLDPLLRHAPGRTSLIDPTTIYFRPPPNYMEPATLLAVLRKLLVRPLRGN